MTTGEITSLVVSISGALPAVAAFVLALRHGWQIQDNTQAVKTHANDIADLKAAKESHDLQLSRLTPKEPHDKQAECEKIHRALRTQHLDHRKHP